MSSNGVQDAAIQRAIAEFLAQHHQGALATTGSDGSPNIAPMFFVADEMRIYVYGPRHAREFSDLHEEAHVAYLVTDTSGHGTQVGAVCTLQVRGTATHIGPGDELESALRLSSDQLDILASDARRRASFERDAREGRSLFFRIDPHGAIWHDNRNIVAWRVAVQFVDGRVDGVAPYGPSFPQG